MRKVAASILLALAGVLLLLETLALIDPAGLKVADDLDPFGDPHIGWPEHAALILIIIGLTVIGWWLWRAKGKEEPRRR